jgi:hypothetical protein
MKPNLRRLAVIAEASAALGLAGCGAASNDAPPQGNGSAPSSGTAA